MAEDKSEEANFTRMVVGSVAITMVLLLILPMISLLERQPTIQPTQKVREERLVLSPKSQT